MSERRENAHSNRNPLAELDIQVAKGIFYPLFLMKNIKYILQKLGGGEYNKNSNFYLKNATRIYANAGKRGMK